MVDELTRLYETVYITPVITMQEVCVGKQNGWEYTQLPLDCRTVTVKNGIYREEVSFNADTTKIERILKQCNVIELQRTVNEKSSGLNRYYLSRKWELV